MPRRKRPRRYRDKRGRFKRPPKIRRDKRGRFFAKAKTKIREKALRSTAVEWIPIDVRLRQIRQKFSIAKGGQDQPPEWIKWANTNNDFWSWVKRFPPIPHPDADYVKVEVWYVVYHDLMKETLIRTSSRAKGLENGAPWEDVLTIADDLREDVKDYIEKVDYLEFRAFVGWSAYPYADWYNKKIGYRKGQF